jgi:hypothetical protein
MLAAATRAEIGATPVGGRGGQKLPGAFRQYFGFGQGTSTCRFTLISSPQNEVEPMML